MHEFALFKGENSVSHEKLGPTPCGGEEFAIS